MGEHRIRLRGGWRDGGGSPGWLTLPIAAGDCVPRILVRDWRLPQVEAGEAVSVCVDRVPGLLAVGLPGDGIRVEVGAGDRGPVEVTVPGAVPRGVRLVLEVAPDCTAEAGGWGDVSVMIRGSRGGGRGMD